MKIEVTPQQAQIILAGLAELPIKVAADTYQVIWQQVEAQRQAEQK